jgi:hypothetical protein
MAASRIMMLTAEAFERAAEFIAENARGVEVARFAVHFEEGSPDEVDDELAAYRNEDGGFAHGIDPDFFCEESSAAATVTALEILNETGAPPDSELVQGAIVYLLETYDESLGGWRKVPASVNEHPHAEWWHHPDGHAATEDPAWWALTNADILSLLLDYPMLVPPAFLERLTADALARLQDLPDGLDMHVYAAYERLSARIDSAHRLAVVDKLTRAALATLDGNPDHWSGYVPSPLWIAPRADSALVTLAPFELENNLNYEIATQRPDGSWRPRRRWRDYPEAWPEAEAEWVGIITLKTLVQLRDFHRIEGF